MFTGEEPHMNSGSVCRRPIHAAKQLKVRRIAFVGAGLRDHALRQGSAKVSCTYSLPRMKKELEEYAVRSPIITGCRRLDPTW